MWLFKRKPSITPDLPAVLKEQALQNPGGWVYEIDAAIGDPKGEVPPFAVKGARKVDDAGQIVGDLQPNKNYDRQKTLAWVAERDQPKE